ncbi:MAG: protein kinase [Pseudomonadota bacterium]|nr:protein kinase [Pseudomonadota bacterium]
MSRRASFSPRVAPKGSPRSASGKRSCLIVHDDLTLRLKLADLARQALPMLAVDTMTRAGFEALASERLGTYCAALLILEFIPREAGADPFAVLSRVRELAPRLPILVFARGGDERCAARVMKMGASDYWPVHSVDPRELSAVLQSFLEPPGDILAARLASQNQRHAPQVAGYRLIKTIAQSSAASVYLAENQEIAHPVALKVQAIDGMQSVCESDRQRFARECELLSTLKHRSIADVLDFGITEEYLFLALEYFPCGSLRDRLKNPLSEADALNYARQIGEALRIVHAAGIVHRDLKPSNLMLTDENRLVLIDFGAARLALVASDITRGGRRPGTPFYVCPEQIEGHPPDERGDLYSLGILLFEMLAGCVPFSGKTLTDILDGHRFRAVPRLPGSLARYQPIVDRLLAKSPSDRYASATTFLEGLDAVPA